MKIYAKIRQEVDVNPIEVIMLLIHKEIGDGWIYRGGITSIDESEKFFKEWEESAGQHSINMDEEISEKQYDYVVALQLVLRELKEKENGI